MVTFDDYFVYGCAVLSRDSFQHLHDIDKNAESLIDRWIACFDFQYGNSLFMGTIMHEKPERKQLVQEGY